MAKVNLPLMSGTVRGKIGDVVFMRRGDFGISVARIRTKPANPRTEKQVAVRHNIKTLSGIWAGTISAGGATLYKFDTVSRTYTPVTLSPTESFTDVERNAWKTYTTVSHQGYRLVGKLAFLSVNLKRLSEGLNPLKTPTTLFSVQQ